MPAERLSMRKLREILRLHFENRLSARAIARSVSISPSTAQGYVSRIRGAGLTWPLPAELDSEEALTGLLFAEGSVIKDKVEPDWATVHVELKRKHVTKQLLWEEYKAATADAYQYSAFCQHYAKWASKLQLSMRQEHRAGEKLFIDFSGDGIDILDAKTGEVRPAKLFVATLGASSYTYVEPVLREDLPTWVQCHINALRFFGGATEIWVPDNPRVGVTKADRYEPELNLTYRALAEHYGVAVIPARVRRPKDKAKVEVAVQIAQRWIIAALRKHSFFSLEEVKAAVKPLLETLNAKPMRRVNKSRRQLFDELDAPALRALPLKAWEYADWAKGKVGPHYHVEFKQHFYSVPYVLVHEHVEVRATATTIELLAKGVRVAAHGRDDTPNKYTTIAAHMPKAHRDYAEWNPPRLIAWAKQVGPACAALVEGIMSRRKHQQHGFRSCMGVMALRKHYEDARIEAACARAMKVNAFSYKSVKAILKNGLDAQQLEEPNNFALPLHENIRGAKYYH
jgi:transposase